MDDLYRFLNSLISKPFVWGECDCMIVLADWVKVVHGFDPAIDLRYTYDSAPSCQRATGYFTDPVATVARFAEDIARLPRTDKPVKGDIGVVEVPTDGKLQLAGAIFTGKSWAIKAPQGATTMIPYSVAAAWSVGYVQN